MNVIPSPRDQIHHRMTITVLYGMHSTGRNRNQNKNKHPLSGYKLLNETNMKNIFRAFDRHRGGRITSSDVMDMLGLQAPRWCFQHTFLRNSQRGATVSYEKFACLLRETKVPTKRKIPV